MAKSPHPDLFYAWLREKSEREDLVMFVNACFAATEQSEYYTDGDTPSVSIQFLHEYVRVNYRLVYARTLAAGVNHFNQLTIIRNLLKAGAPTGSADRAEEGLLIKAALRELPANRVFGLFRRLSDEGVNNRRTRAVIRDYLASRHNRSFDALKYRKKVRAAVRHAHLPVEEETGRFLFAMKRQRRFDDPLFDAYLRAHYSKQAVYELPYTIAEGFADRHGIGRAEFLRRIEPQMTHAEKQRQLNSAARAGGRPLEVDLSRTPLTKLALYVLSLPLEIRTQRAAELHAALLSAARRTNRKAPLRLGKVAAVLDRSRSSCGSRERRRRPLAVAIATHYLLAVSATQFRSFWTPARASQAAQFGSDEPAFLLDAGGQTDLATPLLDALDWQPDQVIIVSDGFENDPADATHQIIRAYQQRLSGHHRIALVHANPVFDPDHFSPRRLGDALLTIGLRDAEDLGASLGFAKFAAGEASQAELEAYLRKLAWQKITRQTGVREQP